jgi:hypothetical protein
MLYSLEMKVKDMTNNDICNRRKTEWRGEKFWKQVDRVMDLVDHPAFLYISLGLLLFGTILGVIAPYLK